MLVNNTRTGDVWVKDFDRAMVEAIGGVIVGDDYYTTIPNVPATPWSVEGDARNASYTALGDRMPGTMINFANPDDRLTDFIYPCIVVRRESIEPADSRWPSHNLKYRAPADGAQEVTVTLGTTTKTGYTAYESQLGNYPFDISYMISVLASGERGESVAQAMLKHVMRRFPPKDAMGLVVMDSLGSQRLYEVFAEGPQGLGEVLDIVDRQSGYSINVRVQAEIDLKDPVVSVAVTGLDFHFRNGVD